MKTLIQGGADPATLKDYDGRTALHLAAAEGRLDVTRFLLRYHDIDVNQVDSANVFIEEFDSNAPKKSVTD